MIDALKKDLKPVRSLRPPSHYALGAVLFAAAVLVAWLELVDQAGWHEIGPSHWLPLGVGLIVALAASAWTAAQWLSPTGKSSLLLSALGISVALTGVISASRAGHFLLIPTATCFSAASVLALFTAAFCLLTFRRAAPQRRERVAVAAGLFSGLLGFLLVQLHCPIRDPGHMLLGHATVPFAWALASYLLVKLFARP